MVAHQLLVRQAFKYIYLKYNLYMYNETINIYIVNNYSDDIKKYIYTISLLFMNILSLAY